MTKMEKMINEVGYWEASEWGASVMSYDIVSEIKDFVSRKVVRYYAIEHGEEFYFDLTFPELYQKYQDLKAHGCV